jgi:hypothetical protein
MNPRNFDLSQAAYVYGLANTPLFLARKLQTDPSVRAISVACTGQEILEELKVVLNADPASTEEAVRPYAYLVALSFKPEGDHLQEAARLQTSIHQWYSYIAETLVATYSPVQTQLIEVPGALSAPSVSQEQSVPTTTRVIIAS